MSRSLHQDLAGAAGVAECVLSEHLVAALPANQAEAPWTCTGSAVLWVALGNSVARHALPDRIRGNAAALAVVGGFIRYHDTPVGSYDEVLGSIGFRRGVAIRGHVAFMAVDSETSLVGGRLNWAMPKTLASFHGEIDSKSTMAAESALKPWWVVKATPRALGPAFPARARATVLQQRGDGTVITAPLRVRARLRPALVHTAVSSDGALPEWLRPGRHLGILVEKMIFILAEARIVEAPAGRPSDACPPSSGEYEV